MNEALATQTEHAEQLETIKKKRYHIRFNTHHTTNSDPSLVWRVFEDGVEHLVSQIRITSEVFGVETVEFGVTKWNICTEGFMRIENGIAFISDVNNRTQQ